MIGVSILSGSHMTFFPEILRLLKHYKAEDIHFIAGGIIPAEDIIALKGNGGEGNLPTRNAHVRDRGLCEQAVRS